MSIRRHSPYTCTLALAGMLVWTPAWAQDGASDPHLVVTRTVHPRIAYRGVPVEDMPVAAQATTFPAGVFDGAVGHVLQPLSGGELLGQHGTAGLAGGVGSVLAAPGLLPDAASLLGAKAQGATGHVPVGAGASIGGAVTGATAGLGDRIGSAVMDAVMPAVSRQDGGP